MTATEPLIHPVILCGGSGTRLWPVSRLSLPKQFAPLIGGRSLLYLTCKRASSIVAGRRGQRLRIVGAEAHRYLIRDEAEAAGVDLHEIILEPASRDTAAAMAVAALQASPEDLLLFMPADHLIPDDEAFGSLVRAGAPVAAGGDIVTFGVRPDAPSTAYGYIRLGEPLADDAEAFRAAELIEKPEACKAAEMVSAGTFLWNAGIFLTMAGTLLAELETHAADILADCREAVARCARDDVFTRLDPQAFAACRSESIDYAVMEKAARISVLPFLGHWSDLGNWNALARLTPPNTHGNRIDGTGWVFDGTNAYLRAPHRPVVALGVHDLLIVDTPDALLVAAASHAEQVKDVVSALEAAGVPQATEHRRDARPWGSFDVIDRGERFQVKHITVKPGGQLSSQSHHHRAEHWIVVSGTARVRRGDEAFNLAPNESTYIPLGEVHSLENPGEIPLEVIEVQSGDYLGEDDIVRYADNYGRATAVKEPGDDGQEGNPKAKSSGASAKEASSE
jgi:mannose-1-phosphate guanylyltransferase/mannose-6-phosphate isomerase